ncbi:MAG: hydrogenase maturation nickel metallochaperone HypA [Ignavibacteria bacterium]
MHELSIAQEIINIVKSSLPDGSHKVKNVKIRVGKLSGVLSDSLKFCFESIIYQSELEGAVLVIEEIPVKIKCNECDSVSTIDDPFFQCKNCQSLNVQLISGKELEITEIELED